MSREDALGAFFGVSCIRLRRATSSAVICVFSTGKPRVHAVFRKLMREEAAPFLGLAVDLVRRFMPEPTSGADPGRRLAGWSVRHFHPQSRAACRASDRSFARRIRR